MKIEFIQSVFFYQLEEFGHETLHIKLKLLEPRKSNMFPHEPIIILSSLPPDGWPSYQ